MFCNSLNGKCQLMLKWIKQKVKRFTLIGKIISILPAG